jgi:NAD(P)-dependent dehydrogenase (short-subunit alcohol dehydrogenase family)
MTGAFLVAKHAIPALRAARGSIVNIASTRALQSEPDTIPYAAGLGPRPEMKTRLHAAGA